jgi:hypothetical protein
MLESYARRPQQAKLMVQLIINAHSALEIEIYQYKQWAYLAEEHT